MIMAWSGNLFYNGRSKRIREQTSGTIGKEQKQMITETAFHFAYYELSEFWQTDAREKFLGNVNLIRTACREIGIQNRDIIELKLSHYILILDSVKSDHELEAYHTCGEVMSDCLEFLFKVGVVEHNHVKDWLATESAKNLYSA